MRNLLKKLLLVGTLAIGLAVAVQVASPVSVQAATKKANAIADQKKAPKIAVGKNYKITVKGSNVGKHTFIKFVIPSTGTYKVSLSGFTNIQKGTYGSDTLFSNSYLKTPGRYGLDYVANQKIDGKSQKGTSTIWMCSKYSWNKMTAERQKTSIYRPSRTITFKATKGQVIYYDCYIAGNGKKGQTYNISVKKK